MSAQLEVQPEAKVQKAQVLEPVLKNRPKEERAVLLLALLKVFEEVSLRAGLPDVQAEL